MARCNVVGAPFPPSLDYLPHLTADEPRMDSRGPETPPANAKMKANDECDRGAAARRRDEFLENTKTVVEGRARAFSCNPHPDRVLDPREHKGHLRYRNGEPPTESFDLLIAFAK